jgi:hypothetical protein
MLARLWRSLGRFSSWIAGFVMQVGGGLNGGRNADESAAKLYEQPRDDYRP